ncbi:MAG TPA: hypothetical protein VGA77_13260, partial [Propylenella sp.]
DAACWRIVDFKTSASVPASIADADPAHILQLALYRRLLMEMDAGAAVEATLIWTAGPKAMPVPAEFMDAALAKLGVRAAA